MIESFDIIILFMQLMNLLYLYSAMDIPSESEIEDLSDDNDDEEITKTPNSSAWRPDPMVPLHPPNTFHFLGYVLCGE